MADVTIKHAFQSALPDDPAYTGYVQPSNWNAAEVFTLGSQYDLVQRDTGSSTGASYTSSPRVATVVFPLTAPVSPPNGSWWVEDDGVTVSIKVKRADGTTVSMDF